MSNTTPAKAKKSKSKAKAVTSVNAKELKAWLRGIQEFQPEGWVPSIEQWDAIRERIFLLEETETYAELPHSHQYTSEPQYNPSPAFTAVTPTSAFAAVKAPAIGSEQAPALSSRSSLATSTSPTESGMVPVTSAAEVLEGEYKSPF